MSGIYTQIEDNVGLIAKKLQALKEYTQMVLDAEQHNHALKFYDDIESSIQQIEETLNNSKSNPVVLQPKIEKG